MAPAPVRQPLSASSSRDQLEVNDGNEDADTSIVVEGLPCLEDKNFSTSFTWHSAGDYTPLFTKRRRDLLAHGGEQLVDEEEEEDPREEEEWIIGIDEAGRGPVLGPQVYGLAYCPAKYSEGLRSIGFADSKTLSEKQRAHLMQEILDGNAIEGKLNYAVTLMHPRDISAGMLQRANYSLNAQSQDVTVRLIQSVVDKGYPISHVYVDPVGPSDVYQAKLSAIFPTLAFTVVPKADAIFPIVSAASIVAKVARDTSMEVWEHEASEAGLLSGRDWGSGYPSDPRTVAWLDSHFDPLFGFPCIARQSWGTVRQMFEKKGLKVKWTEEESINSIRSYFGSSKGTEDIGRPAAFKEMGLTSVGSI